MDENYFRCRFERSAVNKSQWVCKDPYPGGSYVLVWEIRAPSGHELWPKMHDEYIVRIDKMSKSGRSRLGTIVLALKPIEEQLTEALKSAAWLRDQHAVLKIQGESLTIPAGKFVPIYDSGIRGAFETMPSIWFRPTLDTPFAELLHGRLWCLDEAEIDRAKRTPWELAPLT